jgi:hypothetical protein
MVRPTTVSTNSLTNEAGGRLTVGGTIDLIGNTFWRSSISTHPLEAVRRASCGILDAENNALQELASG